MNKTKKDLRLQVEIQEDNIKMLIDENITKMGQNMKLECENKILQKRIIALETLAEKKVKQLLNKNLAFAIVNIKR